jgi:ferric-dicitrate binding protein FerR (iron transport regulator)
MNDGWNRVLREARRDWGTVEAKSVDWRRVDERLFARIEEEQRAERRSLAPARDWTWKAVAAGLAAAAAVAVLAGHTRDRSLDPDRAITVDGGSIVAVEGAGEVLVGGRRAAVGTKLRLGDVIEARGAQATIGRAGKLTLALERGSTATVTHVQGPLVLELTRGAIEAQVVPVASGEAFAVDVGSSRVAVHGTHFRIARTSEQVVVDLNEGVVSIGEAPRIGPTFGGLVTAPAHVEFAAADAQGTLRLTHDRMAVRAPAALRDAAPPTRVEPAAPPSSAPPVPESNESAAPAAIGAPRAEARPAAIASAPGPDPNGEESVAAAVRACMAERLHADDITVVVSTTLSLQVNDEGWVRAARFDPPVAPDVNACAAQSIYKTRFTHGGGVTIPVSVKN